MSEHKQDFRAFREKYCGRAGEGEPSKSRPHFPRSVCEAEWVDAPGKHRGKAGATLVTRSHEVVFDWAGQRSAMPATIPGTWHGDRPGVLRFDFPNWGSHERLEHVSWDEWFRTFDERELVMLFQDQTAEGHPSNFFHFNSPFREHM
jgi:hypothetical protein